jgi:hypothetical protein
MAESPEAHRTSAKTELLPYVTYEQHSWPKNYDVNMDESGA